MTVCVFSTQYFIKKKKGKYVISLYCMLGWSPVSRVNMNNSSFFILVLTEKMKITANNGNYNLVMCRTDE